MKNPLKLLITSHAFLTCLLIGAGALSISATTEPTKAMNLLVADQANQKIAIEPATFSNAENFNCALASATIDQETCAQDSYSLSNRKLNYIYQLLLRFLRLKINRDVATLQIHPNEQFAKDLVKAVQITENRLITSQRAWIQFRNANCYLVAASTSIGGSGEGAENTFCLNKMTLLRVEELNNISTSLFERQ